MAPCRTRNSAVVEFHELAQLFPNLCGDVVGGRQAEGTSTLIDVIAISSGRKQNVSGDTKFVSMELNFWSLPSPNCKRTKPSFCVTVVMPAWWSPRMYLGALSISVKRQEGRIVVTNKNPSACVPHAFNTINQVHWLYNRTEMELMHILQSSTRYFEVKGGEQPYK